VQISTGKRFSTPAEDPVAATRALGLTNAVDSNAQYTRNAGLAKNRLSLEESALEQVGNVLQRLRELAVQANNDSQSADTRAAIASEVRQQLDALVQLGNSQDGNSQYLFSGFSTRTQPFSRSATGVVYNGDQGVRQIQIGPDRRVADSDSGADVFMRIRNGNGSFAATAAAANTGTGIVGSSSVTNPTLYTGATTYTVTFTSTTAYEVRDAANVLITTGTYAPGQAIAFAGVQFGLTGDPAVGDQFVVAPSTNQDLFATAQNFLNALGTSTATPASQAQLHNGLARTIENLDRALDRVIDVRASVGGRLNAIDTQLAVNGDVDVELQSLLSEIRDLDYADAITRLQQQLTSLEAAQKSFAITQDLSLFNFI
jgi:flagellar hook-associated protein 3 FlgL